MAIAHDFIHPNALCESEEIGEGTRVWAFAHIMKGAKIGTNCNIGDHAFIEDGAVLGNRVTVKNQAVIWSSIHIMSDVFIGPHVTFTNDRFPRSARNLDVEEVNLRYSSTSRWLEQTVVHKGASIGAGAVIGPGLTIGPYAMIGAGSVVTKGVPGHCLVIGNPARMSGRVCRAGQKLHEKGGTYSCPHCDRRVIFSSSDSNDYDGGC